MSRGVTGRDRPAGMDDQDILLEAASVLRRLSSDPDDQTAAIVTAIAFDDRLDSGWLRSES